MCWAPPLQTDSKPEKRLGALVNLYNVVSDPEPKLAVLLEALSFAKRAGLADLLLPVIRVSRIMSRLQE